MKTSQKLMERVRRDICLRIGGRSCVDEGDTGVGGPAGMKKLGRVATEDIIAT